MTEREHDKLLAETFHGDWATGETANLPRLAARYARRRRQRRHLGVAAGLAALVATAIFVRREHSVAPALAASQAIAPAPQSFAPVPRGYEIISDEQLMAALRNRPLLILPGAHGDRIIVLSQN